MPVAGYAGDLHWLPVHTGFDLEAFARFERDGWERKARGYHALYAPISGYLVPMLLEAARVGPGTRVLDVGSGPGYVAALAAERGAEAVGLDVAEAMVELARELHPAIRFEQGDAQALPFLDGSFAAVVGNFAIHHLAEQARALRDFRRVLRPGGHVALTAWDDGARCRFLGVFTDSVRLAGAPPADLPAGPPMAESDEAYADLLVSAGFASPGVETIAYAHRFGSADALWTGLLAASVRTAALITEQPAQTQRQIRTHFDDLVAAYAGPDGLRVPVSVKLFSASVPA
jgi:SAM-dependent methyltransferase